MRENDRTDMYMIYSTEIMKQSVDLQNHKQKA